MTGAVERIAVFGTPEAVPGPLRLRAGRLSLEISGGAARGIAWGGTEVLRGLDCPVRDEGWGTYPPEDPVERCEKTAGGFAFERRYTVAGGGLACRVRFEGSSEGRLVASAELAARRDFRTCRAGFVILHPLDGLAGGAMTVRRPDGSTVPAVFPMWISPWQPVREIAGLSYCVRGVEADLAFSGECFEMEDQRNWTDASFKTYCRPLSRPFPYWLRKGEVVRQGVELRTRGDDRSRTARGGPGGGLRLRRNPSGEPVPAVALIVDATCLPSAAQARTGVLVKIPMLRVRVTPDDAFEVLGRAGALAKGGRCEVELEIVLPAGRPVRDSLRAVASSARRSGVAPRRVIALPEAYLRSYQPTDPIPPGPTPRGAATAARIEFSQALIGGGALTHFTEFNRCRPDVAACDYVTHGTAAIFHAADDRSVVDSLEGLAHVFASARRIAGGRPYHLGLVSIGLRTNPHGAGVAPNPGNIRIAAAGADPRQRGLFGAAWAVGATAATEGYGVSSLALGALAGPQGLMAGPARPRGQAGRIYPIFHAVRALAALAGAPRLRIEGLPAGLAGVAGTLPGGARLILANLAASPAAVGLPRGARLRVLGRSSFGRACADPRWLDRSPRSRLPRVELESFEVAFVDFPESPS